ncbi:MFS transporter [Cytobacillus sp. FJAT-54145]|uniref:MFS transporter n=1 Tax=Cytobacillus spartinae TaxID=3299023 RepID=A0ABW6KF98_9BACI
MTKDSWKALWWIGLAELMALSLWFSASVIGQELLESWQLQSHYKAWLSASVPIGFVIGAFLSSYFGIADRFNPRKIFAISALSGALLNFGLVLVNSALLGMSLRILTGFALAGVYPTAVKILSQWFPKKRGLAIGILIATLTLGSALPYLVVMFFSSVEWKLVIISSSLLALTSAVIVNWVLADAPVPIKKQPFSIKLLKKVTNNKPLMLVNYGYFGHMWELYAMWTWLPIFLTASFKSQLPQISNWVIALISFSSIGVAGGIGCVIGGLIADRFGRSRLTILSMCVSAACSILIGFTFGHSMWLSVFLAIIWGIFVISDSAQFSAAVSEFADVEYVGTALTFQMCIGFLITIVSINIIPIFQNIVGWEWVFIILAIGPIFGVWSMIKFQKYELNQ